MVCTELHSSKIVSLISVWFGQGWVGEVLLKAVRPAIHVLTKHKIVTSVHVLQRAQMFLLSHSIPCEHLRLES